MTNVAEIIEVLAQVQQYSGMMLEELETGNAEVGSFSAKVQELAKVIEGMQAIVPATIYAAYQEFFEHFKNFCTNCKSHDFLIENVDNMASSLDLFAECVGAMADECANRIKTCVCCGNEVIYRPLPSYYSDMKKNAGNYAESRNETLNQEEYLCPRCGSSDRDRLILTFLKELQIDTAISGERLLQIAPARTIEHWIQGNCMSLMYHSTDLFMEGVTFQSDIQDMNQVEDSYYDYFICSHVLEHVQDDRKAMRELHRILKHDGIGLFLVPLDLNVEQTDEEWGLSEQENWRRFGQGDHCRKYAKKDLVERLKESGFCVHELGKEYFGDEVFHQCGLTDTSILYVLTKKEINLKNLIEEKKRKRENYVIPQPLVSVILPTYNHVEYVEAAIESVLKQTYKNIEFLVADDGSTDGTAEKVLQHEDKIDEIHLYEENTGGKIIAFLREKSKGKYIAMMHSDDVWEPEKIAMQVEYMESHPECGACFTGGACMDDKGNKLVGSPFLQNNMTKEQWVCYFYEHSNCLAHPSILIHRDLYIKLQKKVCAGMFRQLPDFWMWLNMLLEKEIHIIEKDLFFFRMHENGEHQNVSAKTRENLKRHIAEEVYIWYDFFKKMDSHFFLKAFKERLIKKDASTEQEIMCEKMFVLLQPRTPKLLLAGVFYMYDIYQLPGVMEVMEKEYHWTRKDIIRTAGELLN